MPRIRLVMLWVFLATIKMQQKKLYLGKKEMSKFCITMEEKEQCIILLERCIISNYVTSIKLLDSVAKGLYHADK